MTRTKQSALKPSKPTRMSEATDQIEFQRKHIVFLKQQNADYKEEVRHLTNKIDFHKKVHEEDEQVIKIVKMNESLCRADAIKWKAEAEAANLLSAAWCSSQDD